jgi:hypothetical protein
MEMSRQNWVQSHSTKEQKKRRDKQENLLQATAGTTGPKQTADYKNMANGESHK